MDFYNLKVEFQDDFYLCKRGLKDLSPREEFAAFQYAVKVLSSRREKTLFEGEEDDFDPNAQNKHGKTLLHLVLEFDEILPDEHLEMIEFLLKMEADPNIQDDEYGRTALHCAASNGHHEIVKVLLQAGANPKIRSKHGRTALHSASVYWDQEGEDEECNCDGSNPDLVQTLLDAGIDVNAQCNGGQTPLFDACIFGRYKVMKTLLKAGANPNVQAKTTGRTPLQLVADSQNLHSIRILLDAGADPTIPDISGQTAMDYAFQMNENNNGIHSEEILRLFRLYEYAN